MVSSFLSIELKKVCSLNLVCSRLLDPLSKIIFAISENGLILSYFKTFSIVFTKGFEITDSKMVLLKYGSFRFVFMYIR